MTTPYPLSFTPTFKERIWGGARLQTWFTDCPRDAKIGEAWVLSDHREGPSPVANGIYAGKTLQELMALEPTWFASITHHVTPDGRFPLLVKVIDAADDLSVQVHPDDTYGYNHAGEQGKTECWWVLDADDKSRIVYGHTANSKADLAHAVETGAWSTLLQSVAPNIGDFYFVPSGKLHALGRGTMVLEIQQSSDTTYRVYDYDRVDAAGRHRDLHLQDALAVTACPDIIVENARAPLAKPGLQAERLVACPFFAVEHWTVSQATDVELERLTILSVAGGEGSLTAGDVTIPLRPGSQVLLPDGLARVSVSAWMEFLATTVPAR